MTVHKFESSRKTTVEINEYKHIKRKNMKNNPQKKILRQDGFPIGTEMAKKRYSSAGTTTLFLKQLILTILLFAILPVTALAAGEDAPGTLYVGQTQITGSGYWKTNSDGTLTTEGANNDNYNVYYDGNGTLTLNSATIKGDNSPIGVPYGAGIYAQCSSNQPVALTIELIGTNTITGHYGIYVNAEQGQTVGTNASLLIRNSSDNGILEVSGSSDGIYVKSGTGNASLTINDASVVAKTTQTSSGYAGVCVQSSIRATSSPQLSLAVNGGSLTASGTGSSDGILFYVGSSSDTTNATTSLTVTDNAIVDARTGGISASRISITLPTPTPSGENSSGIVFDGNSGTVYGDVTLQEDLEIGEGESLTIPQGASLNTNGKLTVNGGTLNGTPSGVVTTGVSLNKGSLTLDVGKSETLIATVQPYYATNKNVTWSSNNADVATVENGVVTAIGEGEATITVTTEDGSFTDTCNVTVAHTWGDVSYEWSKDDEGNQTCTATRTCENDKTHTESATATVTSEPTKAPTCTEMGETTYTAEFDVVWASQQTKTIADIDATGHGETKIQNAKEPTCTADGYTGDKVCVVCDDVVEYGTVIPATGHDYENGYCTICGEKDPDYVEPEPEPEPTYYRVDLRPVEGATVILSADEVEEGGTLEGYVADDLMVTVSQGIGKAVEVKPDEAGVYTVKDVDGLVTITVYGVKEATPVGMENIEGVQVYAHEGAIYVYTPTEARVMIVAMNGVLKASEEQVGKRRYELPRGFYVVWVEGESFKVAN